MMKPTFDDVLKFVRSGEEDPQMKESLQLHPDGPELLKQARFIVKMFERQSPPDSAGAAIVDFDVDRTASLSIAESRDMADLADERTYYQSALERRPSPRRSDFRSSSRLAQGDREDLGALVFTLEDKQVSLHFHPSKTVMERYGKPYLLKAAILQRDIEGIRIQGGDITLTLPESLPPGDFVPASLTDSRLNTPVTRAELVFMPESGPFVRLRPDSQGRIELPLRPGTLRIEGRPRQLLHIEESK